MKALCKHYSGNTRLLAGMKSVQSDPKCMVFCIEGVVHQARNTMKINSSFATFLALPESGNTTLYTSNPAYLGKGDKTVEIELPGAGGVYQTLATLLRERYKTTGSYFELTLAGKKANVVLAPAKGEDGEAILTATVQGVSGEVLVLSEDAMASVVTNSRSIKSFEYEVSNQYFDKRVSVRRGYSEIMREVARYINKTLCFVGFNEADAVVEQYVSISAAGEIVMPPNSQWYYRKLTYPVVLLKDPFSLRVVSNTVDEILNDFRARHRRQ